MKSTIIRSIVSFPVLRIIMLSSVFLAASISANCVCNRAEAATLAYATFQENISAGAYSASGFDDEIPEAIAVDASGDGWSFAGTATAFGGIVPMADIQGEAHNTGYITSVVEIFYSVAVTPSSSNAPTSASVPVRYTINANVSASASGGGSSTAKTQFHGGGGWWTVLQTNSNQGTKNYNDTLNASLMPGLPWTLGLRADATIYPGGGSYQAVIDPIFEIDPDAMIEGNDGLMYHANELYEMAYSPNLVPIPAAFLLFGSSLVGIIGIRKKLKK